MFGKPEMFTHSQGCGFAVKRLTNRVDLLTNHSRLGDPGGGALKRHDTKQFLNDAEISSAEM